MDFNKLNQLIKNKDAKNLKIFMQENDLTIKDGSIIHKDPNFTSFWYRQYDMKQMAYKILMNAA